MSNPVVVWLRQDLRLSDHSSLIAAAAKGPVIFLYVLDDEAQGAWAMGGASRWWLHKSLEQLKRQVPVILRRGRTSEAVRDVLVATGASALTFTRGYAPWSAKLEGQVKSVCDSVGVECHRFGGYLLHEPESIRTGVGEPYKVYTPFSRACFAIGEPRLPKPVPAFTAWKGEIASDDLVDWQLLPRAPDWSGGLSRTWQPGEASAQERLRTFIEEGLSAYAEGRDYPDRDVTSRLSPHLHFGEISPIQCWHAVRLAQAEAGGRLDASAEKFLKELLWREFSGHLLYHWPSLPEQPFRPEFADFPWRTDATCLTAWQRGLTGYPIVDAGMRELWATGIMHNRVRMIAASFLIKHLLIPWQDGERWFWDTLVDADIANNAASWQWVAGCGADAAPYFRIFNPVLQGEKFDPHGAYVRRWVPELASLPDIVIHRPWEVSPPPSNYPPPIVDHARARAAALAALASIKGKTT